jgi:hypothetical protein
VVPGSGGGVPDSEGGGVPDSEGGGVPDSEGGGAVVAGSDAGAVVAGEVTGGGEGEVTSGGAVGEVTTGDGEGGAGTSAGPVGVTGAGWAAMVSAGAGIGGWLLTLGAGVTLCGRGGMACSGRAGPSGSPPVVVADAGAVTVTAAPGRACTVPLSAFCHSHSATPVVATATVAVGANSHGDSSHPNRSRRGRPTRDGSRRARLTRGGSRRGRLTRRGPRRGGSRRGGPWRGGTGVVVNQPPNASGWSAGRRPAEPGSGGVTGAAGRCRAGRRLTPAVRGLLGRRGGGCGRSGRRAGR